MCVSCHNKSEHAQWQGSMHDARNVSCTTCHSVHNPKSEKAQLKAANTVDTCATCHKTEAMKVKRAGHMPVREGKMDCTACHNPHGSTSVRLLKVGNWVNETCVSCHTEKRGPYLWDHAPVREACNTCHDPHGSNNERMLVAKLPMLCQRCHIGTKHPSTIYDGVALAARSSRLIGRGCVNCHAQIHGSNSPAGNAFLR
jgi:DmsE family decaheme c-type cytochrome